MSATAVFFDIGGVLLDGEHAMPGAVESLQRLRGAGVPYLLLTNTTRRSHAELLQTLQRAGMPVSPEQLLTPAQLARAQLMAQRACPLLLIHPGLQADFDDLPQPDANRAIDNVVIGDAADAFTYANLNTAFRALMAGADLLSLSDSRYFRQAGALYLDAGPYVRLLEEAAGVKAVSLGKPSPLFYQRALDRLGLPAAGITMIGDDVVGDIQGACSIGLAGILVQTGKFRPQDSAALPAGATLATDVAEAVDSLLATRTPNGAHP
jgi:HAD superfamily hydrolase (TIGR01458 family)